MTEKGVFDLKMLAIIVDELMKSDRTLPSMDKIKKQEFIKIFKNDQEMRLLATDGAAHAREYTRNRVLFILGELGNEVNSGTIDGLIFQYHINYYKNIFTASQKENIKKPIDSEIEEYFGKYSISMYDSFDKKLAKLAQILYQELYGYSILDELIFESDLNEVACNRFDYIWIQYKGIKRRIPNSDFYFESQEAYERLIENRLTSTAREEMNAGEPIIYATLLNGFRVTALRPPLSKYFVVNIRLFNYKNLDEQQRNRFMEDKMLLLLEMLTGKGRRNVAIIGEQGSGKTTGADELVIKRLDNDLSIGLAENIHELNISCGYPGKNVVELQYTKDFKPSDITEMFFRLNRDIIIYGEVRNSLEAFEMIKAMLRQARGSLFTFHSSSVRRMIHDLRQLLMQTGYYTDYREAQFDVADAVDLVVHIKLERSTGTRYVYKISEVVACEKDMTFETRDLFIYEKEMGKYLVNRAGMSSNMLLSCLEYEMTSTDIEQVKQLFMIKNSEEGLFYYMDEVNERYGNIV